MSRKLSLLAIAALFLSGTGRVMAGGPPLLSLPIDGVTAENVEECSKLLAAKLENKLLPNAEQYSAIEIREHANQWYATFYFAEDVGLSEVEAALEDSPFSIPRDRLHLFGHIILEIDADAKTQAELLDSLEAIGYVSVAESEAKANRHIVTVDMPYPKDDGRARREAFVQATFQWNHFASDQSKTSQPRAMAPMLPSYDAFQEVVSKHDASLIDIRWSTDFACRAVGGVAVADEPDGNLGKTAQAAVAR